MTTTTVPDLTFEEALARLNERQQAYVMAYVMDPNPTRAARAAGYANPAQHGHTLRWHPEVSKAIELWRGENVAQLGVDYAKYLLHLERLAYTSVVTFMGVQFDPEGKPIIPDELLPLWDAVQEVTMTEVTHRDGTKERAIKFKLPNKIDAARLLGQVAGFLKQDANPLEQPARVLVLGMDEDRMFKPQPPPGLPAPVEVVAAGSAGGGEL